MIAFSPGCALLVVNLTYHERVDPRRIGVFGSSLDGFAALVAAGGVPDLRRVPELCAQRPDAPEWAKVVAFFQTRLPS